MERIHRLAGTALTVCSGIVFGAIGMTGVVAAVVFPTMRSLDPALPGYAAYGGGHWSLAAGMVAERVFGVGLVAAGVALSVCVAAAVALALAGRAPLVRLGLVAVTAALFAAHAGWLQPRMDAAAAEYRTSARAGEVEAASAAKARFDGMHPVASRLIGAMTVSSLALFVASAWAGTRPGRGEGDGE